MAMNLEEERLKSRKFCIDTPENRLYAIEHIDEAPINGIPIIKYLLEKIKELEARIIELEKK